MYHPELLIFVCHMLISTLARESCSLRAVPPQVAAQAGRGKGEVGAGARQAPPSPACRVGVWGLYAKLPRAGHGGGNGNIKPETASTKTQDQVVADCLRAGRAPAYQMPFQPILLE